MSGDPAASAAAQPASRTLSPALRWAAALLFAVLVSDARSLTLPASLLVLAGGLGIWWAGKHAPPPLLLPGATVSAAGVVVWAVVFGAFAVWELGAFAVGNNDAHPTFSMLSDPVLSFGPTRRPVRLRLAGRRLVPAGPSPELVTRAITIGGFVAIVVAGIGLEVLSRRPAARVASVGDVLGHVMRQRTGRVLVFVLWFWFGWHFIAR